MNYYVYEHWRPDTREPFYVGKGIGNRAYRFERRSVHHGNIVQKLALLGLSVRVRIVRNGLSEEQAFDLEKARIRLWRGKGVALINRTDGGDGSSGYRHTEVTKAIMKKTPEQKAVLASRIRGITRSAITRERIRQTRLGLTLSDVTKEKIRKIMKQRIFTDMHRARISESLTGRAIEDSTRALWSRQRRGIKRGPLSDDHKAKISAALQGHEVSEETRRKIGQKAVARASARAAVY